MTFLVKTLLAAILIALGETVNGIVRLRWLYRLMAVKTAKVVSVLTGCAIIFALTWVLLPWIAPASTAQFFIIGGLWLTVLLAYDLFVGRVIFKQPWAKIADDFNLAQGNYLSLGMAFLFCCPLLVAWLRG